MYERFKVPGAEGIGSASEIDAGAVESPPGVADVETLPVIPSPRALKAEMRNK